MRKYTDDEKNALDAFYDELNENDKSLSYDYKVDGILYLRNHQPVVFKQIIYRLNLEKVNHIFNLINEDVKEERRKKASTKPKRKPALKKCKCK